MSERVEKCLKYVRVARHLARRYRIDPVAYVLVALVWVARGLATPGKNGHN